MQKLETELKKMGINVDDPGFDIRQFEVPNPRPPKMGAASIGGLPPPQGVIQNIIPPPPPQNAPNMNAIGGPPPPGLRIPPPGHEHI